MIRARESKSAPVGVVGKVLRILEALDAAPITRMNRDRIQAFAGATGRAARTISARLSHAN